MEDPSPRVVAVILAGGTAGDPLATASGVATKALVPVDGRPMVAHVLEALERSKCVSSIVCVGIGNESVGDRCHSTIPSGNGFAQSLALGIGGAISLGRGRPILVVTADVPWLTAEAVDRFVAAAQPAELAYPIVPEDAARRAFPSHSRTFVRLKQGRFTGGNLMLLSPRLVAPLLELIDRVYRARKNPWALAGLVGPGTVLALLSGRADLPRLERLVSDRLGGRARAIVSEDACLAADVDRLDQLELGPASGERR